MSGHAERPHFRRVALIGIGLINGSLALVLRRAGLADEIVACARTEETLAKARALGLADRTTTVPREAVAGADLVVLGVPVGACGAVAEAMAPGLERHAIVSDVGSIKAEVIRAAYPDLTYIENRDWERNNILLSLLCARDHLSGGFVSTYADIVYRPQIVADLVRSPHDITLACDTDWRRRYIGRSQHPETDAEKLRAQGDRVLELSRRIPSEAAREVVKFLKDSKMRKVQASIQGDQLRVTSPSKDELQEVMRLLRERDFGVGYGNSSGYASHRRYTTEWAPPRFRFA